MIVVCHALSEQWYIKTFSCFKKFPIMYTCNEIKIIWAKFIISIFTNITDNYDCKIAPYLANLIPNFTSIISFISRFHLLNNKTTLKHNLIPSGTKSRQLGVYSVNYQRSARKFDSLFVGRGRYQFVIPIPMNVWSRFAHGSASQFQTIAHDYFLFGSNMSTKSWIHDWKIWIKFFHFRPFS